MIFITWFTTHLALESLFVWTIMGASLRSKYLESRRNTLIFLLTSFASIGPDSDYVIRLFTEWIPNADSIFGIFYHRGATHSIFFPLIFLIIGVIIILIEQAKNPKIEQSDSKISISSLIGYSFLIASVFWGLHLILDIDSAEGGMVLFWPFDDGVYQPRILIELLAYPFLLLPWTPQGLKIDVDYSTLQSLQIYLLNWTPSQIIDYFGSPNFFIALPGLILHIIIFILYLNYVVKPLWVNLRFSNPFASYSEINTFKIIFENTNRIKFQMKRLVTGLRAYWNNITKWALLSILIIIIIGFSLGPMLGSALYDVRDVDTSIRLTNKQFIPTSTVVYESFNQPLDPSAVHQITLTIFDINVTNSSLALFIGESWKINEFDQRVSAAFSNTGDLLSNENATDDLFKQSYRQEVSNLLQNSALYTKENFSEKIAPIMVTFTGKQKISISFFLYDWISSPTWNTTNISAQIAYTVNIIFDRETNFIIGVFIQSFGMLMLIGLLIRAFFKNKIR